MLRITQGCSGILLAETELAEAEERIAGSYRSILAARLNIAPYRLTLLDGQKLLQGEEVPVMKISDDPCNWQCIVKDFNNERFEEFFEICTSWDAIGATLEKHIWNPIDPDLIHEETGRGVLRHVACRGDVSAIRLLLKAWANVNLQCAKGHTALYWAIERFNLTAAEVLLEKRLWLRWRARKAETGQHRRYILQLLLGIMRSHHCCWDICGKSFTEGRFWWQTPPRGRADVNARDACRSTPLHCAASIGAAKCAEELLQARADAEARDDERNTPWLVAMFHGQEEIAQQLVRAGVNIEAVRPGLDSPLEFSSLEEYAIYCQRCKVRRMHEWNTRKT